MKGRMTIVCPETNKKLEMKLLNVTCMDSGIYTCSAWNKYGYSSRTVNISVECPTKPKEWNKSDTSEALEKSFGDTARDMLIGGACGIIFVIFILLIVILYIKVRGSKTDANLTEQPTENGTNELHRTANDVITKNPSMEAVYGNRDGKSACATGEQDIHYASIHFSKSSSSPMPNEQNTEYSEIRWPVVQ
ncbi:uncharacterized protein O3C94_014113 [Discoglossus pictus]